MRQIVEVVWEDVIWTMDGDFDKAQDCRTLGYIITTEQDPEHIVIAGEVDSFGEWQSVTKIPNSLIREVNILGREPGSS